MFAVQNFHERVFPAAKLGDLELDQNIGRKPQRRLYDVLRQTLVG